MDSGSHSLTLERLYAWEKKLYEEVKVSSTIVQKSSIRYPFLYLVYKFILSTEKLVYMQKVRQLTTTYWVS